MKKNKDSKEIKAAIRLLVRATDKRLVLLAEEAARPKVFLLVGIKMNGKIEYQVSDGMDCHRSMSHDFNNLSDAIAEFDRVCEEGW